VFKVYLSFAVGVEHRCAHCSRNLQPKLNLDIQHLEQVQEVLLAFVIASFAIAAKEPVIIVTNFVEQSFGAD
jgi:hypothetical protein